MPEFLENLPDGWKAFAFALGAIGGGFLMLRQYLSGAEAQRVSDQAQIAAIDVYKQMVAELRSLLDSERARSDNFARERNEAVSMLADYKAKIADMTRQIELQSARIEAQSEEIRTLREQLESLKA